MVHVSCTLFLLDGTWKKLLGQQTVNVDAHLFDLDGHARPKVTMSFDVIHRLLDSICADTSVPQDDDFWLRMNITVT